MKRNLKKIIAILMTAVVFANVPYISSEANTAVWEVYYSANGGNKTSDYVGVYVSGGGYDAVCNGTSGNCSYKVVSISSRHGMNRAVQFTAAGTITFNTVIRPTSGTVNFTVSLSYDNGTSAGFSGSIRGR